MIGLAEHRRRLRSTRPTVAYAEFTFARNLGDEACLVAARSLFGEATVVDWGRSWPIALRRRASFHAAMLGGGTLVGRQGFLTMLEETEATTDGPSFMIGAGVEDPESERWGLTTPGIVKRWQPTLARMSRLSARGPRSADLLRELYGVTAPMVGDLALALDAPIPEASDKVLGICIGTPGDGMWGSTQHVLDTTVAVARTMLDEGWRLQITTVWPIADRAATAALVKHRVTVSTCTKPRDFLAHVGRCTMILGERLHALVLASVVGVPTLAMAYRPKTEDFMASIGRSEWSTRTSQVAPRRLVEQLVELADDRDRHSEQTMTAVGARRAALRAEAAAISALVTPGP